MILLYLFIFLLSIPRIRFLGENVGGYLDKERCDAVKGVFIWIVFVGHIQDYVRSSGYVYSGWLDYLGLVVSSKFAFLLVVPFLFFSGYGVGESIRIRGKKYLQTIPRNRLLTVWVNFCIAVAMFALATLVIGHRYSVARILLSFIGWESVGNSNWYIFVILCCYAITYVSFKLGNVIVASVAVVLSALGLSFIKEPWWYSTMWAYPAGLLFAEYREKLLEPLFRKKYWQCLIGAVIALLVLRRCLVWEWHGVICNLYSIAFAWLIVMLMMKINLRSPFMIWSGRRLFPLYIYQRLPMILFAHYLGADFVQHHVFMFEFFCFLSIVLIAFAYPWWQLRIRLRTVVQ